MRTLLFLTALAALGLSGCGDASSAPARGAQAEPGPDPAPGSPLVEVASAEALVTDLDALDAEMVVLNFWATWCGPCRMEFPEFIRFDREMGDQGVHVRFVSLDQPVDLPLVQAFLLEHQVDDPSYLYTGQGDVTSQLNPFVGGSLPITMILDGEGIVQHTHVGRLSYADLVQTVTTLQQGGDPSTI